MYQVLESEHLHDTNTFTMHGENVMYETKSRILALRTYWRISNGITVVTIIQCKVLIQLGVCYRGSEVVILNRT